MSSKPFSSSARQDWLIGTVIGLAMLALGLGAWLLSQRHGSTADGERPPPVWVDVGRITPQMADGNMANIKVDLQLDSDAQQKKLTALAPAFKSMIAERSAEMSREELLGPQGMQHMAKVIRSDVNNYLRAQRYETRVSSVAFEEFHVLP